MERKKETKYERKTMNFIKEVLNYILLQEKLYLVVLVNQSSFSFRRNRNIFSHVSTTRYNL